MWVCILECSDHNLLLDLLALLGFLVDRFPESSIWIHTQNNRQLHNLLSPLLFQIRAESSFLLAHFRAKFSGAIRFLVGRHSNYLFRESKNILINSKLNLLKSIEAKGYLVSVSVQLWPLGSLVKDEISCSSLLNPILQKCGSDIMVTIPIGTLLNSVHLIWILLQNAVTSSNQAGLFERETRILDRQ